MKFIEMQLTYFPLLIGDGFFRRADKNTLTWKNIETLRFLYYVYKLFFIILV